MHTTLSPLRLIGATLIAVALGGCSLFGIRTADEAGYAVVDAGDDIELRDYTAYVTVETVVAGDFNDAGNEAFRRLFGYISGDNRTRQDIEMTAPVIASEAGNGEDIEMTVPVIAAEESSGWRYAFVLPGRFTLDNAPLLLRDDVVLRETQPRRVAVLTFAGAWRESRFRNNLQRLLDWIDARGLEPVSQPRFASYDPPWAIPFLRRNEIMIDVDS